MCATQRGVSHELIHNARLLLRDVFQIVPKHKGRSSLGPVRAVAACIQQYIVRPVRLGVQQIVALGTEVERRHGNMLVRPMTRDLTTRLPREAGRTCGGWSTTTRPQPRVSHVVTTIAGGRLSTEIVDLLALAATHLVGFSALDAAVSAHCHRRTRCHPRACPCSARGCSWPPRWPCRRSPSQPCRPSSAPTPRGCPSRGCAS